MAWFCGCYYELQWEINLTLISINCVFSFFFNREIFFCKIACLFISFGVGRNFFAKLFGYSIILFLWINLLPEIGIFGTSIKFRRFLSLQKNFQWNLVFTILRWIYHKTTLFSNRLLYLVNAETQIYSALSSRSINVHPSLMPMTQCLCHHQRKTVFQST